MDRNSKNSDLFVGIWMMLFVVATSVCIYAIINFLKQQPTLFEVSEFNWLNSRCWFEPCSIDGSPSYPWQRYGTVEILRLGDPEKTKTIAIGSDGTIVEVGIDGIFLSTPPYRERVDLSWPEELLTPSVIALGSDGTVVAVNKGIFLSTPPYREWDDLNRPELFPVDTVALGSDGTVVVGGSGGIFRSTPPYFGWDDLNWLGRNSAVSDVALGSDGTIVVVGIDGIFRSTPPYLEWVDLNRPELFPVDTVALGSDGTIVVGGNDGIFRSTPPYLEWDDLNWLGEISAVSDVALGSDGSLAMLGSDKFVLGAPITFAILTWILLAATTIALVFYYLKFILPSRRQRLDSDIPVLEPDIPIEDPNQATEATQKFANRIYRFVRNPSALAPLTIALTGKWGCGKSSLMNLVERNLRDDHCPCVWFNAWHHQNETHLFAALMESIRLTAVPKSFIGFIEFHLRLVMLRFRRIPIPIVLSVLFSPVCILALFWLGQELVNNWEKFLQFPNVDAYEYLQVGSPVGLLLIWFGWMKSRLNPLKAFPITPANLIRESLAWGKFSRFRDQLSFRHHFGSAFKEVCSAFDDRRLVIIIDDLDRCKPEQVVVILEAVNFLTTNGNCFVLLGIDENQVTCAVGLHYRDIANEMASERQQAQNRDNDGRNDGGAMVGAVNGKSEFDDYGGRRTYASHYLEKLVNLRIKVPVVNHKSIDELRKPNREDQS